MDRAARRARRSTSARSCASLRGSSPPRPPSAAPPSSASRAPTASPVTTRSPSRAARRRSPSSPHPTPRRASPAARPTGSTALGPGADRTGLDVSGDERLAAIVLDGVGATAAARQPRRVAGGAVHRPTQPVLAGRVRLMDAPVRADVVPRPRRKDATLVNRRLLPSLLVAGLLLAVPAGASAKTNVAVGIGDQSPSMFADANWKALNIKKTRYFVEWNTIDQPGELAKADAFVAAARGRRRLGAHAHLDRRHQLQAAQAAAQRQRVQGQGRRARREATARRASRTGACGTRPTTSRSRRRRTPSAPRSSTRPSGPSSARTARSSRSTCSTRRASRSTSRSWLKAAGSVGKKAKIIGIHNYSQVNRRITEKNASDRYPGIARIIKAVRKKNKVAKFWLTETGGLASFGSVVHVRPAASGEPHEVHVRPASRSTTRTSSACTATTTSATAARRSSTAASSRRTATPRAAYNTFKSAAEEHHAGRPTVTAHPGARVGSAARARVAEWHRRAVLKTAARKSVRVRIPPRALSRTPHETRAFRRYAEDQPRNFAAACGVRTEQRHERPASPTWKPQLSSTPSRSACAGPARCCACSQTSG